MSFLFDLDHWQEIKTALLRNRLRTALTAFGVFWGIFLLMVMLGIGRRAARTASCATSRAAPPTASSSGPSARRSPRPGCRPDATSSSTNADVQAIRDKVPEAEVVAPRNQLGGFMGGNNVTRGRKTGAFSVMGDYPEIQRIQSFKIVKGRFLSPIDIEEMRKVAVIGTRVERAALRARRGTDRRIDRDQRRLLPSGGRLHVDAVGR